jgi:hypothetical protein
MPAALRRDLPTVLAGTCPYGDRPGGLSYIRPMAGTLVRKTPRGNGPGGLADMRLERAA